MARTHGKRSTYRAGCHCDSCRQANTEAVRRYRARKRSPLTGPQLRQCFVHRDRLGFARARSEWLAVCSVLVGRRLETTKALTEVEARLLLEVLRACRDEADLAEKLAAAPQHPPVILRSAPTVSPLRSPAGDVPAGDVAAGNETPARSQSSRDRETMAVVAVDVADGAALVASGIRRLVRRVRAWAA